MGCFKSNILMIPAGLKSKCFLTAATSSPSDTLPVLNVSMAIETGSATPKQAVPHIGLQVQLQQYS